MPPSDPCIPVASVTLDADGNLPCPAGRPTKTWVLTLLGAAAIVVVGASVAGSWGAVKFSLGTAAEAKADESRARSATDAALVAADAAISARVRATEDSIGEIKQDVGQVRRDVGDIRAALYDYMTDIEATKSAARLAPRRDGGAR